jgi:hypothetical protein
MKAGATDFLRKPFTADMLRNSVQAALRETPPEQPAEPARAQITYWAATLNGYSISSRPHAGVWENGELSYPFDIRHPGGRITPCSVVIRPEVVDQIKDRTGNQELPGGEGFWRKLCSHVVADYLWQNSDPPAADCMLSVTLTKELATWIDSLPRQ